MGTILVPLFAHYRPAAPPVQAAYAEGLRRQSRPPILKRFASETAEGIAGNEMALEVERVLDSGMNGQEPLCVGPLSRYRGSSRPSFALEARVFRQT